MLDLDLDFDQLSKETFDTCRSIEGQNPFGDAHTQYVKPISYPNSPGMIFRIEAGVSTFCIRSFPTFSIEEFFKEEAFLDREVAHSLRLSDIEDSKLLYFETPSIEVAEVIADQLSNRRFPFQDDDLFNLSDPGHNWWLSLNESGFTLSFKGHQQRAENVSIRLGPIGDHMVANAVLSSSRDDLVRVLNLSDIVISDRHFKIEAIGSNPLVGAFKNLLLSGEDPTNRPEFHFESIGPMLYCYLQELSYIRRFWIFIEKELHLKTNKICQ